MKCSMKTKKAIQGLLVAEFDKQMIENGGSWLDECEQVLRNDLLAIGKETLGELLSSYDERVNHSVEKCACGGAAKRQLRREAQLLSVFGWTVYQRGYYHCAACGSREYRLDVEQGIRPRQASREMAKLMSMAGVTTSFAEASKQLAAYLLVEVSPNTIRKETYAAGQRQAENEAEEIADSQQEERLQQREREWIRPRHWSAFMAQLTAPKPRLRQVGVRSRACPGIKVRPAMATQMKCKPLKLSTAPNCLVRRNSGDYCGPVG